jgi:ABC-2 type transport system permease protein
MFSILIKEVKEFLRDKTSLFFFIIFPAILVFLLGNLLGSLDKAEATIGDIHVQYIIETNDVQTVALIEGFVKEMNEDEMMSLEMSQNIEFAKIAVVDGEIDAAIIFTEPFGIQILEGSNVVSNRTITVIMTGFAQTGMSLSAISTIAPETLSNELSMGGDYISQKDLGVNRTMLDYYAIAMMTMMTMMSMISGAYAFTHERSSKTLNRLLLSPKNRWALYLQKVFGTTPQILLQTLVIMVFSVFAFGAKYAATLQGNVFLFLMIIIVALAIISTGALLGLFLKTDPIATLMPILWITMFFGGTYSKELYIDGVSPYMPSLIIQNAAFDITVFGRYTQGLQVILVAVVVLVTSLSIGVVVFHHKKEER